MKVFDPIKYKSTHYTVGRAAKKYDGVIQYIPMDEDNILPLDLQRLHEERRSSVQRFMPFRNKTLLSHTRVTSSARSFYCDNSPLYIHAHFIRLSLRPLMQLMLQVSLKVA